MFNTQSIQSFSINPVHAHDIKNLKPKTSMKKRQFGFPSVYICDIKVNGKEVIIPLYSFDYYNIHFNVVVNKEEFN